MDSQYTVCQKSIFGSKIQVDENLFIMVILDFDGKMDTFDGKNTRYLNF